MKTIRRFSGHATVRLGRSNPIHTPRQELFFQKKRVEFCRRKYSDICGAMAEFVPAIASEEK
jgi:hypothetical protein